MDSACLLTRPERAARPACPAATTPCAPPRQPWPPLSPEDCQAQSMPDCSPVKWHLAHTTWFFETFLLSRHAPGYRAFHPSYRMLFNSYYNAIGARHPRPQRGLLTRPDLAEVLRYREHVDEAMHALIARQAGDAAFDACWRWGSTTSSSTRN